MASITALVALLQLDPGKQDAKQVKQESSLLEEVAGQYGNTYIFVTTPSPNSAEFKELFEALLAHRLLNSRHRGMLQPDRLLRVLQCIRLLSRDNTLRETFVQRGAVEVLATLLASEAVVHFSGALTPYQIETLTECASIVKRLAGDEWGLAALVSSGVHDTLVQLLNSTDPTVLPLVLVGLIGFAAHREHYSLVATAPALEVLLHIVQQYDLPFKRLAADLLALLSRRDGIPGELLALNGLGRLVGQLQSDDPHLTQSLLRVLCYMASDGTALQDMYQVGCIPALLALVQVTTQEVAANAASDALPSARITEMQLACTALTRLAEVDEMAVQIRQCNGVTLLGKLLLVTPAARADGGVDERSVREVGALKTYVFRALRYLFSVERNRKVFKRVFPPDLFAAFIDTGHYTAHLPAYTQLVQRLDELSAKQLAGLSAALDDISGDRDSQLRCIHGYVILEMLGKGAFGAVYKARRSRGETLVALKELPLADVGLFGATESERNAGVGRMGKEVEILSSLSHPNIVQYYESFSEGPYLYISMELVEGTSLLDYINSLAEKNKRMAEADVWQVLIAVSLALNYIHGVKQIVHRDLTPSNIVLGQGPEGLRHSKIADFGLAKALTRGVGPGGSVAGPTAAHGTAAQSVVGTMPYTCPEIIQQEPYTEKADVWSLGCVLYHMLMLRPPFDGTNPLAVASRIVEASYAPLTDPVNGPPYSDQLKGLVSLMMTPDPKRRPGIAEVGARCSNQLMLQLDKMASSEQRLTKSLQVERSSNRNRRGSISEASGGSPSARTAAQRRLSALAFDNGCLGSGANSGNYGSGGGIAPSGGSGNYGYGQGGRSLSNGGHAPSSLSRQVAGTGAGDAETGLPPHPPTTSSLGMHSLPLPHAHDRTAASSDHSSDGTPHNMSGSGGYHCGPGSLNGYQSPGGNNATAGRIISIASSRLKPVSDPLAHMLHMLHKLMWLDQLPPGLARDHRRRCIESFRRLLFGAGSNAASLKAHLAKLMGSDAEMISDPSGHPVDFGSMPLHERAPGTGGPEAHTSADGCLSYEQLHQILEGLLQDKGYYAHSNHDPLLMDQFPAPNFNSTGPGIGR